MIFKKYGKAYQLKVDSAQDLDELGKLRPALWAVSSAPKNQFHVDHRFINHLDTGNKGRVRVGDLQKECAWLLNTLSDWSGIDKKTDALKESSIAHGSPDAPSLRSAIAFIQEFEPQTDTPIHLATIEKVRLSYFKKPPNGDGIIVEGEVDENLSPWIKLIGECMGYQLDLSGRKGIGEEEARNFERELKAWHQWESEREQLGEDVLHPFGESTEEALELIETIGPMIDLFYAQCRLLSRDQDLKESSFLPDEQKSLPKFETNTLVSFLSRSMPVLPNREQCLKLDANIEEHWASRFLLMAECISKKVFGQTKTELYEKDWLKIKAFVEVPLQMRRRQPKNSGACLTKDQRNLFIQQDITHQLMSQIQLDLQTINVLKDLDLLEKLLLYQKYMISFCCNFVNFSELYDPAQKALFEEGRLIFDGYALTFSMRVQQRAQHKAYALHSKIFIVYAEITEREQGGASFEIAAPITAGNKDSFRVGKRGIFRDHKDIEWDAKILEVIDNPISISEAVRAPFIRAFGAIQTRFESLLKSPVDQLEQSAAKGFEQTTPPSSPPPSTSTGADANTRNFLLASGVAFAALGSSLVYAIKTLASIPFYKIALSIGGLMILAYSCAFLLAWLSLRKRDLTSFMEASNWAVNLKMPLVKNLCHLFTREPKIPKEAKIQRFDQLRALLRKAESS